MNSTPPTILIVDDSPADIDILSNVIGENYKIKVALNGEDALRIAAEQPQPDLILLDYLMPKLDGRETCEALKANAQTAEIPIIFVTAVQETADETAMLYSGAVDYITKPIIPESVRARVHTHLELSSARRKLKEIIRLREDMDVILRHDLKGPLNAIIGFPELILSDDSLDGDLRRMIEHVRRSGLRLLQMINSSLDLIKIERRVYDVVPEKVSVSVIVRSVLADFQHLINEKGLDVQVMLPNEAEEGANDFILGEELLIFSAFSNLIKNAIEAAPEQGFIRIKSGDNESEPFQIINSGTVPPELRQGFFEKFVTSGKSGGSGLGTYSAKLMIEVQGGSIALDTSEPDQTCVQIWLPRFVAE